LDVSARSILGRVHFRIGSFHDLTAWNQHVHWLVIFVRSASNKRDLDSGLNHLGFAVDDLHQIPSLFGLDYRHMGWSLDSEGISLGRPEDAHHLPIEGSVSTIKHGVNAAEFYPEAVQKVWHATFPLDAVIRIMM
jgi:hypothetical protein